MKPANRAPDAFDDGDAVLRALLEHGSQTVAVIDAHGCILAINRVADGRRAEDVIGRSVLDAMPAHDPAAARAAIDEVLRTGAPGRFETAGHSAGGAPGCWITQVLPVAGARGAARALLMTTEVTDARRAEQALRTSEARLQALAAASSDVVYRMNPDWTEMRHLDGRDFVPDPHAPSRAWLAQYIPAEEQPQVQTAIAQAIGERKPLELEHRVRRVDGTLGWTRSKAVPMLDEQGAIVEWVATAVDVNARHLAQNALADSEERLRLALEAAEEGLWDWNLVTGGCYFSPAYDTMLGYVPGTTARAVTGVQALMHPDDGEVPAQGLALLQDPGQFVLRFRLRHADGGYRWIESHGKTVQRDDSGRPLRAVGTHVDITQRLCLEDALRRSEARLRSIVEGTTDAIFVVDAQGRHLLVNQALCAMTGRTSAELLGRDVSAFLPAGPARAMLDAAHDVMSRGEVISVSETLEWIDGERRSFHTTKGPLRDATGKVVGMFGIARDMTEMLRIEEAQRQELKDGRDLLDLALAGAELGTWDNDLVAGTARYDERYCAMLGYGQDELAPTMDAWLALIHPDDRPMVLETVRAHDRGETRLYEVEHRLRHKDGHWVWVLARGKVHRDASGKAVRAVGTHQDITDRKRVATEGAALLKKIEALIAGLGPRGTGDAPPPDDHRPAGGFKSRLSGRNREVLALLAAGHTAAEIAQRLGIAKDTANTHRRNLMRKLGLRNKAELIRYAIENGIGAPIARPSRLSMED